MVVQTIAATRTRGGLRVEAALDTGDYPTGVAISKERMAALPLERHATRGAWNYTLHPQRASGCAEPAPAGESRGPAQRRQAVLGQLADPRLTGMSAAQLQQLADQLAPALGGPGPAAIQPAARRPVPASHRESRGPGRCSTTPRAFCSRSSTSGRSAP